MNAAIRCQCGLILVYDSLATTRIVCPECERQWFQQAPMFGSDGSEAEKLPYLVGDQSGEPWSDEFVAKLIRKLRRAAVARPIICELLDIKPCSLPEKLAFCGDGPPVVVRTDDPAVSEAIRGLQEDELDTACESILNCAPSDT